MSGRANNRLIRVQSFGNSYVISSEAVKSGERLQIRFNEMGGFNINRLSQEEWENMTRNLTNSVSSPVITLSFSFN